MEQSTTEKSFLDQIKILKQLTDDYKGIQTLPFYKKPAKKTITFAYALYDRKGLYSVFNIWYALNNYSEDYKCYIAGIGATSEKLFDAYDIYLPADLCRASDIIVFPFVTEDLKPVIAKIKKINHSIEIGYQIDFDFIQMDSGRKHYNHFKNDEIKAIVKSNVKAVDRVICPNENLWYKLFDDLKPKDGTKLGTIFTHNTSYLNIGLIDGIEESSVNPDPTKPIRIGIIVSKENRKDLKSISKHLKEVVDEYKGKVQIVAYGDEAAALKVNLAGIKVEFHKQTGIDSYYRELVTLNLRAIIIPANDSQWNNNHYELEQILELNAVGIPVIVSDIDPVNKLIIPEKNGYVYEDKDHFKLIMKVVCDVDFSATTDSTLQTIKNNAYDHVREQYDISKEKRVKIIESIFH